MSATERTITTIQYWVIHDPLRGWMVVDAETDTHTCHSDRESALREAKRKEEEK